jgi:hypothetical protein
LADYEQEKISSEIIQSTLQMVSTEKPKKR